MTDYTEKFVEDRQAWADHNSPGATEGRTILQEDVDEQQEKINAAQRTAYDSSDLGATGPSPNDFDYQSEYENGNAFKSEEEGGVLLNNTGYKAGHATVAGRDITSGKQYTDEWMDNEGEIEKGRQILSKGKFDTVTGARYDQTDGLFHVANGIIKEGGNYDDFMDQSNGPWSSDQLGMAWHAADVADRTMRDIDTQGKRYYDEMVEKWEQYEGIVATIPPEGYTEETLSADKSWIDGNRKLGDFIFGEDSNKDKTDEEIAEAGKFLVSQLRNNFELTMSWASRIIEENDPELARVWLALDAQYDALEMSTNTVGRFAAAQMNITNLVTFGGGILITNLGKQATQAGIRAAMEKVAMGTAFDAGLTGVASAAEDYSRQKIEIEGEQRGKVNPLQTMFVAGTGAVVGAGAGGILNSATNKTIRDYAANKSAGALKVMRDNLQMPGPGPIAAQRGSVGFPVTGSQQVDASFRLQTALGGLKDGAKPITIRENIKAMVNKGQVTPQEIEWSGIEKFLAEKEMMGAKVSKQELINHVEKTTPRPVLVPVEYTEYEAFSLGAVFTDRDAHLGVDGYQERMIVLPERDPSGSFGPDHFVPAVIEQLDINDAMIGHSRAERVLHGQEKGKMILEIQSDYHTEGGRKGYKTDGKPIIGDKPIQWSRLTTGQGHHVVSSNPQGIRMYDDILKIAKSNDIDPYAKNSLAQVHKHLPKEMRDAIKNRRIELQPYKKDWDVMGMRLEIMDSINNGDDFVAWPASGDQVSVIEKWGVSHRDEGIVKRSTETRAKAMKKLGLEVEKTDLPYYENVSVGMKQSDMDMDEIGDIVTEYLAERNMALTFLPESGDGGMQLRTYPNAAPNVFTATQEELDAGEILETINGVDLADWYRDMASDISTESDQLMSTVFNVIRLTPEVKAKFLREGMPMYGTAPVAAIALEKEKERKRDASGRFKK